MAKKKKQEDPHQAVPEDVECVRAKRSDEHITKCTTGFGFKGGARQKFPGKENRVEVHHIFCCRAAKDAAIPKSVDKQYLDACFAITNWNINEAHNTIGLPRKWAYVKDKDSSATGWNGYACHMVDHDLYLHVVETWLKGNVWGKLDKAQKDKKCKIVNATSLEAKLKSCTDEYKPGLTGRQTLKALEYCHDKNDDFTDDDWFKEFSMWPESARRRAKINAGVTRPKLLDELKKKVK